MTEEITDLYGEVDQEAMYQAAIHQPLERKIEQAIGLIRLYENQALQLSEDGYYVCFSGGKDSIVMAKLFEMAGVKYGLHYNNVTIDPPELVRFIKREYPQAVWNNPDSHLFTEVPNHATGLPTRTCRWCCEIYKEQGGNGLLKAIGVRSEESKRRKGLWNQVTFDSRTRLPVIAPVLYWTDADIWQFIRENNMPYCELYNQGFSRLGCVGCPLGGKNRVKEFEMWPRYKTLWKRAGEKWWVKYRDKLKPDGTRYFAAKFPTFESYWSWWMEDKNVDDGGADCQLWLW